MSTNVTESELSNFWALMGRMYRSLDAIREASNRIVALCDQIDVRDSSETFEQSFHGRFDATEVKRTFSDIQKEINLILSHAHEISPHLSNKPAVATLSTMASLLLSQMSLPANSLGMKLGEISWGARAFAQSSNRLVLSPNRKSIRVAFGIDVGSEWARLKAYIEKSYSNY